MKKDILEQHTLIHGETNCNGLFNSLSPRNLNIQSVRIDLKPLFHEQPNTKLSPLYRFSKAPTNVKQRNWDIEILENFTNNKDNNSGENLYIPDFQNYDGPIQNNELAYTLETLRVSTRQQSRKPIFRVELKEREREITGKCKEVLQRTIERERERERLPERFGTVTYGKREILAFV